MSFDLVNSSGAGFHTGNITWFKFLSVAMHYGWKPRGSLPPEDLPEHEQVTWDGSYWVNFGQIVTAEDAAGLADALERSLSEVEKTPDEKPDAGSDPIEHLTRLMDDMDAYLKKPELPPAAVGVTNLHTDKLRELVAFCRQGGFQIY